MTSRNENKKNLMTQQMSQAQLPEVVKQDRPASNMRSQPGLD